MPDSKVNIAFDGGEEIAEMHNRAGDCPPMKRGSETKMITLFTVACRYAHRRFPDGTK
jgi:hypothetical protein